MDTEILSEALHLYRELKVAKEKVKKIEDALSPLKDTIKGKMGVAGKKLVECAEGYAKWVDTNGRVSWDSEKLEERLGEEVEDFRSCSPPSQYIKFGLYETSNQE